MKKLFLSALFLFAAVAAVAESANLIRNGSFADGMKFWHVSDWKQKRGTVAVQDGAAKIVNTDIGQMTMFQQGVKLKPKTDYVIRFKLKLAEVVGNGKHNSGAAVMLLNNGKYVFECSPAGKWRASVGSCGWKEYECTFTTGELTPNSHSDVYPILRHASGAAYFTALEISEREPDSGAPLKLTVFPAKYQRGKVNLVAGFPQTLHAELFASGENAKNMTMELDLPDGIRFLGASPWWYGKDGSYAPEKSSGKKIVRDGKNYTTHTITLDEMLLRRLLPQKLSWNNYERIWLLAEPQSRGGNAYFRLASPKAGKSQEWKIELNVLPELAAAEMTGRFQFMICYLYNLSSPIPEVREASLDFLLSLSRRPVTFMTLHWNRLPAELQKKVQESTDFSYMLATSGHTPLGPYAQWRKENNFDGNRAEYGTGKSDHFCPGYLADHPESPVWHDYTVKIIRSRKAQVSRLDWIDWDIEPMSVCYCEYCRTKFAKAYALPLLTAAEIKAKHAGKFFEFRVKQNGKLIGNLAAVLRKYFPEQKISLVTDPLHAAPPHVQEWCGVDVRMIDSAWDLMRNMPYYSGISYFDDFAFNRKQLKTPQFPLNDPGENMEMFYTRYTPKSVYMNILATAALGGKGFGIWPSEILDGTYYHVLRNAGNAVARAERYYEYPGTEIQVTPRNVRTVEAFSNQRKVTATIPDLAKVLRSRMHEVPKAGKLLSLFNYSADDRMILEVPPVGKGFAVRDLLSGEVYSGVDGSVPFLVAVEPESVKLIEFVPGKVNALRTFDPNENLRALEAFRKSAGKNVAAARVSGAFSAGWGVLPSGGAAAELSDGKRTLGIDPGANGSMVSYRNGGGELLADKSDGKLDELLFEGLRDPIVFAVKEFGASDGKASVRLRAELPPPRNASPDAMSLAGVVVEKKVELTPEGVASIYEISNPTAREVEFQFRLRHYPRIALPWEITSGKTRFSGQGGALLALAPGKINPFGGKVLEQNYAGAPFTVKGKNGTMEFSVDRNLSRPDGVMVWYGANGPSTVEPFWGKVKLAPGAKYRFAGGIR